MWSVFGQVERLQVGLGSARRFVLRALRVCARRLGFGLVDIASERAELMHLDLHVLTADGAVVHNLLSVCLGSHTPP